jgi:hypothetical protein
MDYCSHTSRGISLLRQAVGSSFAGFFLLSYLLLFPPYCLAQDAPQFSHRITEVTPMSTTYSRVKGWVTNNSDTDFREVSFNLVVYNKQGLVLGQTKFSLRNLTRGKTKEFLTTLKAKHKLIDHYQIYFISGVSFERPT